MPENLFVKNFTTSFFQQRSRLLTFTNNLLFYLSLLGLGIFIYELGFVHEVASKLWFTRFYKYFSVILFLGLSFRLFLVNRIGIRKGWFVMEYLVILLLLAGMGLSIFLEESVAGFSRFGNFFRQNFFTFGVIWYVFLIELSKRTLLLYQNRFNPALLFAFSFIGLIFMGTGLLLLPRATVAGIGLGDALFTATSAVCVTGLITVDTATYFTPFGKTIIILLIQIGGLGIMTFTSFLGMFFYRSSSFQNQLFMQNMVNEENFGQTMRTIINIVKVTLLVEGCGAALLYLALDPAVIGPRSERIAFALFHAVSAFCNAGFSTLTEGLYDRNFRFAYGFQSVIMGLIVVGGIGFPILFNFYRFIRDALRRRARQFFFGQPYVHAPRHLTVHSKLVLTTTAMLLLGGAIIYFITEYNSTLQEHSGAGKLVAALFGSVTPRTAGFNTVNMAQLTVPTILIYLLLMWIGGSPASTAGGIKTTTFAVAILNTLSIAKGKDRLEVFRREVAEKSVNQAFALMLLSALVIGLAIFLILVLDPGQKTLDVAFEVFSAYSTVGLSLGITAKLSMGSKLVLIITMFLGRVGTFTLIAGMITKVRNLNYRYPTENVIIT
ncbi:MAG: TrkH family potassium uptake protein [Adhaeribacter sp.]